MGRALVFRRAGGLGRAAALGLLASPLVAATATGGCSKGNPGGDTSVEDSDGGIPGPVDAQSTDDQTVSNPPDSRAPTSPDGCVSVCNTICTNTLTDPKNCGACGNGCGTANTCVGGTCLCAAPTRNCNRTCVDTSQDPSNCGACDHNCQGGTCADSLCVPTSVAEPPTGTLIEDIAVDSTTVYWTLGGSAGGVFLKPLAGGNAITIASPEPSPVGIAVNSAGTNVYWADFGNGSLNVAATFSAKMGSPAPMAIVHPAESGPAPAYDAIALDMTYAYVVDYTGGTVTRVTLANGVELGLASSEDRPVAVAVDAQNVYWVDTGTQPGQGAVVRTPIAGGTITTMASGQNSPVGIALDGNYVYWTSQTNPGLVQALPKGATATTTPIVIAQNQGGPTGIVVDSDFVYWTNYDDNTVNKVAVPGDAGVGHVIQIASGQNTPAAMAIDQNNVYWASQGGVAILKVAK